MKEEEKKVRSSTYKHGQESVQRPDVGVEAQFPNKKTPKTLPLRLQPCAGTVVGRKRRSRLRRMAADPCRRGGREGRGKLSSPSRRCGRVRRRNFTSLSQCAARLRSLTKPFLNWTGKAERQQITVPTLPLFVHERHSTQAILETLKSHKAPRHQPRPVRRRWTSTSPTSLTPTSTRGRGPTA